jgi:serine/threonine-protein kinase HipA
MAQRAAEVVYKGSLAGTLEETAAGGTRFIYGAGWADPIACALPVTRREHEWANGVHPFFQHLGPEGWLRQQQAYVAHIQEQDDFGLLLQFGADCIGAVGVRPPAGTTVAAANFIEATANPGRTVSGVQRKLLVVREQGHFAPAAATGGAPFIAKFNSEQ